MLRNEKKEIEFVKFILSLQYQNDKMKNETV